MSQQESAPDIAKSKRAPRGGKSRPGDGRRIGSQRDVSKMMAVAWEKFDSGQVKSTIEMLKRVLKADRGNPVATAMLGFCYMRQRRFQEGDKLMKRALEAAPDNVEVQSIYAKVLYGLGQINQAVDVYSRALALDPHNGSTYRDLGILLIDAGVLDQAVDALITAVRLNSKDAKAFYHLGLIKKMQGDVSAAINAYSMAVALKPDYAEAHVNLAKIAIDNGKYELGEKSCHKAIEADPRIPQAYLNLCMVKRQLGDFDEAIRYGKKAIELDPISGAAYSNLGNVYMDQHRYKLALTNFRKAMEFEPSFASSYFNCGNALRLLHDLDKAGSHYDKAIELAPDRGEFVHNRGLVYFEQGKGEKALENFRRAVELCPNEPGLQFSLARSLWRNGYFEESWDYFDAGLTANLRKPVRHFRQPRWRGEDISDKRIMLWREQGLGDEIDFSRRFPHMIEVAGEVAIEADERLLPIFARSFPGAEILPDNVDAKADLERTDFDVHLPEGNLLQYFPLTEEEIACKTYPEDDIEAAFACGERSKSAKGYLEPHAERMKEMAERVAALPDGFRLGICWRSSMSHRDRDIHYTRLEMWEPIFRIPGLVFVNLFYDECEEEIAEAEERFGIKIHRWDDIDLKNDMEAAFALTAQMDMVLSTASSPSRIAEAVGKEVWLMTAGGSCRNQPPKGEYGVPHHIHWQRHWTEPWSVLMERMARALEARLKG
ncbi:tetratricopeptide repeat protein [Pelagibius marinus]|uniref:tetratricopeptide repeat protein n=1 Tax=Pelagibius marinus TaxID=2762760 RepID=UPI001872CDDC|nr:tetratricopeptide repeat protein [Pelagibius marinus]